MKMLRIIEQQFTFEISKKGSRFIGYILPINSPTEVKEKLKAIRDNHPKARHFCFAYRIGRKGQLVRAFDDGEPTGSAGKPMLNQLESFRVTNIIAVVVRYFGGILLGSSGLYQAYKEATRGALEAAHIIEVPILVSYSLTFQSDLLPELMHLIKRHKLAYKPPHSSDQSVFLCIDVPVDKNNEIIALFHKMDIRPIVQNEDSDRQI